jgi:cell division protein FtsB
MQQAKKYLKLIERVALGVLIASLSLGIYFAFYPKVKDREKYKQIYLSNEKKIEELIAVEKKLKKNIDLIKTDPIYAEQVAHEKGYARENETIFYFPANEEN